MKTTPSTATDAGLHSLQDSGRIFTSLRPVPPVLDVVFTPLPGGRLPCSPPGLAPASGTQP